MKKVIIIGSIIAISAIIYFLIPSSDVDELNTTNSSEVLKKKQNNFNISILLDLSDRIDTNKYSNPTMQYYKRDLGYINSIADAFKKHLSSKKIITINDRIQMFFDPAPANPNINSMLEKTKIELNRKNITKEKLNNIKQQYKSIPPKIYKLTLNDNHYIGSDTWGFFKNKINNYCIKENYRNILIILTDGYIYHENNKFMEGNRSSYITPISIKKFVLNKSDWKEKIAKNDYGFIKANSNLNNLEVLVLGLNPSKKTGNPYELDILKSYWSNWFDEMGIKKYQIKETDLPSNLDEFIQNFILNN